MVLANETDICHIQVSLRMAKRLTSRSASGRGAAARGAANTGQAELRFRTWGGARAGAGRPRSSTRMSHQARPRVSRDVPLHVTLRVAAGVPSLRSARLFRVVRGALAAQPANEARIVHYSVQSNHLHLIVEAASTAALARGLQGFTIRLAKRLNRALGRKGRLVADRFHARPLATPLEVRRALGYVLDNYRRHADQRGPRLPLSFLDPCSSAAWFDGWRPGVVHAPPDPRAPRDPCPTLPRGTSPPRSYLLRRGWRRHGLLSPFEPPPPRATRRR